jgi:M6 family metalloprotease-like protein
MKKSLLLFMMLCINFIFAAPYNGTIMQFKQPDGSFVDVKLYGTEYYMRGEGLDNYTLIRDEQSKYLCYARLSEDGDHLLSTGIIYKGKSGLMNSLRSLPGIAFHLDINSDARNKIIFTNKGLLNHSSLEKHSGPQTPTPVINGTPVHHVSGNISGLCIVIDFPDEPATLPMSEFSDFCNDLNYSNNGNNGSLRKFYYDISGGLVDYQNVVYGYYHAQNTFAHYDSLPFGQGAIEVLDLALHWIQLQGFDFSTLSLNADSSIMAINIMYTGNPPNWSQGMWYHQGNYSGFSANGVHTNKYNTSPANAPLTIGTVAHENGHMIGNWPDTYKYDASNGPDGIGSFDLMCAAGDSYNPVPPNPLFRSNAGWGRVVDVTNYNGLNYDTVNSMTCYRYNNINDTNEFYLMESRMWEGRSISIPDQGLTIWHINRNGDNQTLNNEVWLEHADDNIFDESFACYHTPLYTDFNYLTTPSSGWYNGDESGLRVWDISAVDTVITYRLGSGVPGPALNIQYVNISNDNNGNGFIESGESADVNVNSLNNGQLNSTQSIASCNAVGANASFVTVNTPSINIGVINVSQTIPGLFNITINPSTPIGTVFSLRFSLMDSTDTSIVTKIFVVGEQIIMDNTNSTTCTSVFYDPGFLSNYNNSVDAQKTIYPGNAGNYINVKFNSFDLEDEPACAYDFLEIHDGPAMTSPLIGIYCGNNSPDSVHSTDPGGALTFYFHSDGGVTGTGWEAHVECVPFLNVDDIAINSFYISPNPTNGILNINSKFDNEFYLYDIFGRRINKYFTVSDKNYKIDISDLNPGVYFMKSNSGKNSFCKKIILDK